MKTPKLPPQSPEKANKKKALARIVEIGSAQFAQARLHGKKRFVVRGELKSLLESYLSAPARRVMMDLLSRKLAA